MFRWAGDEPYASRVPGLLRIPLRLLGLVLSLVGAACAVMLVWPGPGAVAEALGVSCADSRRGPSHQCDWLDAADLLWTGCWVLLITGLVLVLITRPDGKGPLTIDLRRMRG